MFNFFNINIIFERDLYLLIASILNNHAMVNFFNINIMLNETYTY